MSRDEAMRQHKSRLLQLAESSATKSTWRRRGFASSASRSGSGGTPRQLQLQDLVRNDPSYTPNIEHLVFPERRNSNPNAITSPITLKPRVGIPSTNSTGGSGVTSKPTRSRLAEVFALSKFTHHSHPSHGESTIKSFGSRASRLLGGSSRKSSSASATIQQHSVKESRAGGSLVHGGVGGHHPVAGGGRREGLLLSRRWMSEEPVQTVEFSKTRASPETVAGKIRTTPSPDTKNRAVPEQGKPRASPESLQVRAISDTQHHASGKPKSSPDTIRSDAVIGGSGGAKVRCSPSPDSAKSWQQSRSGVTSSSVPNQSPSPVQREDDMPGMRGQNVSVLHIRSSSENWETGGSGGLHHGSMVGPSSKTTSGRSSGIPTLKYTSGAGSLQNTQTRGTNYASLPSTSRRRDSGAVSMFVTDNAGDTSPANTRELSPVRWCDREVDGVFLGRSGWVQVQQRSLDENRRASFTKAVAPTTTAPVSTTIVTVPTTTESLPTTRRGIKLANYHCSKSEPGKLPETMKSDDQQRPAFLPLPIDLSRRDFLSRSPSPSNKENNQREPFSPPPITPILSPPPAFQDSNRKFSHIARIRSAAGKTPFLPRSDAIDSGDLVSPPPSPPPINWNTLPVQKTALTTPAPVKPARKTLPSPVSTPQQPQQRVPQIKSMEDTTGKRRSVFQKHDSSSSSSSSFGFRSLDSTITPRTAMPRLSETDSSIGGYEDGDEASPFVNVTSGFPALSSLNVSPDGPLITGLQPKERPITNGDKVSPSTARHREGARSHQRTEQRQNRRSPGSSDSAGNSKKQAGNDSSSSSGSSCERNMRRASGHTATKHHPRTHEPPPPVTHIYHTWDGRNRVRRSRSLQLPESKSPGSVSPAGGAPGTHSSREHTPPEYQYFLVKNYAQQHPRQFYHHHHPQQQKVEPHRVVVKIGSEQSMERPRRPFLQQRKTQSEETGYDKDLLWDPDEEARLVTEYLHGTRSRAAARALLMQRYHDRFSKDSQDSTSSVIYVNKNKGKTPVPQQQPTQPRRILTRGITTPSHLFSTSPEVSACNPNTCDFWPHCAHRGSLHPPSHSKPSTPSPSSSLTRLPPGSSNLRLSQTYPSTQNQRMRVDPRRLLESDKGKRPEISRGGHSSRSSPASLERVDDYDAAILRKMVFNGVKSERVFHSSDLDDKRSKWRDGMAYQHSQMSRRPTGFAGLDDRKKLSLDTPPTLGSSIDRELDGRFTVGVSNVHQRQGGANISLDIESSYDRSVSRERKVSPVSGGVTTSRSPSAKGGSSSASSSSSDVWVTTSDRTVTKSPKTPQKSSGGSTPLEDGISMTKSPLRDRVLLTSSREMLNQRPGSAPTERLEDKINKAYFDAQQRSLSLPKSFLSPTFKTPRHR